MFIENGFDVTANDGKNGANCLDKLCWSLYDQYIVEIAELLFEEGADPYKCMNEKDKHGILDSIDWKLGSWMTGEYEEANIFEAYYELAERVQNGKPYRGIRAFRYSVGAIVERIEKISIKRKTSDGEIIRTSYAICCKDNDLIVSDYVDFIVNPYSREEAIEIVEVTEEFSKIVGARIKGLRYQNNAQARLNFDNGYSLLVQSNASMGNKTSCEWISIVESQRPELPETGTKVERICFPDQVSHGTNFQYYEEASIVLQFENWAYSLYAHKQHKYAVSSIRVERFKKESAKNIKRYLSLHNLVLQEVHKKGEAVEWVRISCDEGMFYINSTGFTEIGFYLAHTKLRRLKQ